MARLNQQSARKSTGGKAPRIQVAQVVPRRGSVRPLSLVIDDITVHYSNGEAIKVNEDGPPSKRYKWADGGQRPLVSGASASVSLSNQWTTPGCTETQKLPKPLQSHEERIESRRKIVVEQLRERFTTWMDAEFAPTFTYDPDPEYVPEEDTDDYDYDPDADTTLGLGVWADAERSTRVVGGGNLRSWSVKLDAGPLEGTMLHTTDYFLGEYFRGCTVLTLPETHRRRLHAHVVRWVTRTILPRFQLGLQRARWEVEAERIMRKYLRRAGVTGRKGACWLADID